MLIKGQNRGLLRGRLVMPATSPRDRSSRSSSVSPCCGTNHGSNSADILLQINLERDRIDRSDDCSALVSISAVRQALRPAKRAIICNRHVKQPVGFSLLGQPYSYQCRRANCRLASICWRWTCAPRPYQQQYQTAERYQSESLKMRVKRVSQRLDLCFGAWC